MKPDFSPVILIDTREQLPYTFDVPSIRGTLSAGDYSVAGLEGFIAVERKSLTDAVGSLLQDRKRFEAELAKLRALHKAYVVIECNAEDVLTGNFQYSRANPASVWESICAFSVRYIPFVFGGSRESSAKLVQSLLLKYARENLKAVHEMETAAKKYASAHTLSACG